MDLKHGTADQLKKLKGQGDWEALMQKLLQAYQAQTEAQKPKAEEISETAKSRYIPTKTKKYVIAKTNRTCAFPGCTKPHKIIHHTERFALTHAHRPDNLAPLCKVHEQIAHCGLIENEERPYAEWRVRAEADKSEAKYLIDQKVQKYRAGDG